MKLILIIIGIIIFLSHTIPLIKAKINIGNIFAIFTGISLIISAVYYDKIIDLLQGKYKYLFILILLMIIIFYLAFFITLFIIIKNAKSKTDNEKTIIVLGCRVKGLIPTKALLSRCESAYKYLIKNDDSVAVLSGGQGSDELISEAECMKNILVKKGIDESKLFIENKSTSTWENLKFSKKIIEENKLDKKILICTSEYHLYRADLIAKELNIIAGSLAAKSMKFFRIPAFTREVFGIWYLKLKKRKSR